MPRVQTVWTFRGRFMGLVLSGLFLLALGICSTLVCCGALVLLVRVPLLVAHQRATLSGVKR